ncbi:DoxX family protein [Cytophagaceae bacterium DM2B3-1]|uniref:DoxX family protein n=1 Tax=Xanthocytophaga flava TaxID=3048013 RepID=A0ABT7CF43_9BACT|nr:DoxX family protein [Xanthocytophaga flavus]MDJ1470542.1 DoxX family protein [Xanthocytophaga flavus]MDJ1491615.1 DoxX family protein [Xanthocytophaga flavus]
MKKLKIIYWVITGIMVAMLGLGSIFDAISAPEAVTYVTKLGYPAHIVPFLGVAKLLGIIAILIPGYPRIKEWAYAGLTFDLLGALYSHISNGDPASTWIFIFIPILLVAGSYIFYHKLQEMAKGETATYAPQL